jgi:glycosyltransferase involved in cell wall biosynthesis
MKGSSLGLRVLVGVHDGGLSGIDTYAEQVALAAATSGHEVTLLTTTSRVADDLSERLAGTGIVVLDAGLEAPSRAQELLQRLWPAWAKRRLQRATRSALAGTSKEFCVAHMNHPGLAGTVRPFARRVYVAAWFYPHHIVGRLMETWRHGGGIRPRSIILLVKSLSHYLNDAEGYRKSDCVVAPTTRLARQLISRGIPAAVCPPPVQVDLSGYADEESIDAQMKPCDSDRVRLVICCGDLSHPRKNVESALAAVRLLPPLDRTVQLTLIGHKAESLHNALADMPPWVDVVCPGGLPPGRVHAYMRQADALLFPSLFEEWGYVAVESLLCGTPVVTFPVYPFEDMLNSRLGVQARDCSSEAFADAILEVLRADHPSTLARTACERYGSVAVGRQLTDIWTSPRTDLSHSLVK